MAKALNIQEFFNKFSTDEVCLEHLMMLRFGNPLYCPKCGAEGQFAKLKKLPAYACPTCGHHIHPMVGTPSTFAMYFRISWPMRHAVL